MSKDKPEKCQSCKGTGKLVYSNTGIENDCLYCNGFGVTPVAAPQQKQNNTNASGKLRQHNSVDSLLTSALMREHPEWEMETIREAALICSNTLLLDWLQLFADDIAQCFIPKCCRCYRRATEQTTKGKHAQENLYRPVNWGYYCKKHADEGREIEREAMYG